MTLRPPSFFERYLLPGFAFKAVVIGGGYATGRELAEYFLRSGAWGGIFGLLLAMLLWSILCPITFLLARITRTQDYGSFFNLLLGPASFAFDVTYLSLVLVALSVFAAAAGAIGNGLFGWPPALGALALGSGIAGVTAFGNQAVERLFKYVTIFLYLVYVIFFVLVFAKFSHLIGANFSRPIVNPGWAMGGLTYTGYSITAAVVILPALRHLTSDMDAVIAGVLCGPLALLPALVFYLCMVAFYPDILSAALPSEYLLRQLNIPVFHAVFQVMIFFALLESGTGGVHAINERVAKWVARRHVEVRAGWRFAMSTGIVLIAMFTANRFGLIALIATGYRVLSYIFLGLYVGPLLTYGLWLLISYYRRRRNGKALAQLVVELKHP